MTPENIFNNHEHYNRHMIIEGLRPFEQCDISPYITHCKLRKAIRNVDQELIDEFNRIKFGERLNERNVWTKERIIEELTCEDKEILQLTMELWENEGLLECLLFLFKLGKYSVRKRKKYAPRKKRNSNP